MRAIKLALMRAIKKLFFKLFTYSVMDQTSIEYVLNVDFVAWLI